MSRSRLRLRALAFLSAPSRLPVFSILLSMSISVLVSLRVEEWASRVTGAEGTCANLNDRSVGYQAGGLRQVADLGVGRESGCLREGCRGARRTENLGTWSLSSLGHSFTPFQCSSPPLTLYTLRCRCACLHYAT
ncbi:hypothetical protein FB45DRAFT_123465 [Roridomyces roridus]|uniref:Uncharacterized protein n=1 Tax=Roridomyces roridus TaxID=1738132 RepID=A0AAD7BIX6_9AGAR|nr:hypothetical protein FB45DRAFT_123465 [Roridomyces roridus]